MVTFDFKNMTDGVYWLVFQAEEEYWVKRGIGL